MKFLYIMVTPHQNMFKTTVNHFSYQDIIIVPQYFILIFSCPSMLIDTEFS